MPPKRSQQPPQQGTRGSSRIHGKEPEPHDELPPTCRRKANPEQPARQASDRPPQQPQRQQSVLSGLSTLSTPPAPDWPTLAALAKGRIDRYAPTRGMDDRLLARCLRAFIDFLPEGGRESIARDIIDCGDDDDKLFGVFYSLYSALLSRSKFNR